MVTLSKVLGRPEGTRTTWAWYLVNFDTFGLYSKLHLLMTTGLDKAVRERLLNIRVDAHTTDSTWLKRGLVLLHRYCPTARDFLLPSPASSWTESRCKPLSHIDATVLSHQLFSKLLHPSAETKTTLFNEEFPNGFGGKIRSVL